MMKGVKKMKGKNLLVMVIFLGVILFSVSMAMAEVAGRCDNCHTMHYSQDGGQLSEWGTDGPYGHLLITNCEGCHSSATSSTTYDLAGVTVPVVFYRGASAPTSYLAGGNFWWVKEGMSSADDTKGHNVFLNEPDDNLDEAPGDIGFAGCASNDCHSNLHLRVSGAGELDGRYGCQGCHLNVRHHANDHLNGVSGLVTTADQGWYRFLSGHMSGGGSGVEGYEDGHWEAGLHDGANHQGAAQHNEYLGVPDTDGGYGFGGGGGHTTSSFCTGCHQLFHDEQYSGTYPNGNWMRHPSDAIIRNVGEYADVGGTSHLYDPLSPVGKQDISDETPDTTVTPGSDVVMCLSCHRPHASPYADLLRWDYATMDAGSDPTEGTLDQGCFYCHTQKDN